MYMANHDIVLIADIATPTNWTRHRGPFAPPMSCASGTEESREEIKEMSAATLKLFED